MNNSNKSPRRLLLFGVLVFLGMFVAYWRERGLNKSVQSETVGLKNRLEHLEGELAAMKQDFSQALHAVPPILSHSPTADATLADVNDRIGRLETNQSNLFASPQIITTTPEPTISPEKIRLLHEHVIAEIKSLTVSHKEKLDAVKSKLNDWQVALKIQDDVASLDAATALKTSNLVNYWPYFEAKLEAKELLDFGRLLNRKLQIEELDLAIETARQIGTSR